MPVEAKPLDVLVLPIEPKKGMFLLYYREGQNPHAIFKFFFDSGEFKSIIERAKKFCERTNKRFVRCEPAVLDFDLEERRLNGDGS